MKIVVLQGGIGNQLFQYCLYRYLDSSGHKTRFLNYVNNDHQGYVLEEYFDVQVRHCGKVYDWFFRYVLIKLFRRNIRIFISDDNHFSLSFYSLYYIGYWHHKKYILPNVELKFKDFHLNKQNEKILNVIKSTNSVSLHVRRGDYLLPQFFERFGNVCTTDYYRKAMAIVQKKIETPQYIVFSDDITWCRQNLDLPEHTCFVDWNTGDDSILDMYLMSKCKANIIANSSFSFWGAKLSGNSMVIYPVRWFNDLKAPLIFEKQWLGI